MILETKTLNCFTNEPSGDRLATINNVDSTMFSIAIRGALVAKPEADDEVACQHTDQQMSVTILTSKF